MYRITEASSKAEREHSLIQTKISGNIFFIISGLLLCILVLETVESETVRCFLIHKLQLCSTLLSQMEIPWKHSNFQVKSEEKSTAAASAFIAEATYNTWLTDVSFN